MKTIINNFVNTVAENLKAEFHRNGGWNKVSEGFIPNAGLELNAINDEDLTTMMKRFMQSSIELAGTNQSKAELGFWCAKVCHHELGNRTINRAAAEVKKRIASGEYTVRNVGLFA